MLLPVGEITGLRNSERREEHSRLRIDDEYTDSAKGESSVFRDVDWGLEFWEDDIVGDIGMRYR